ncbi:MAG: thiamine phosphate synthase [Myxococcales bacterium]|nr:thiamine phosphate synthase [Myxococcales bacterium]
MRGLYAIADVGTLDARGLDAVAFARAVLRAKPAALQLRAKDVPPREALALLRAIAPLCHLAGVPLVANDRPDLAILAGCDLVHVGQDDMPIDRVRRIAPGIGVGVSTHTLEQLEAAFAARPSYVAIGPIFETSTKRNADPVVGLAVLRAASVRARAAGVPLVAIGGITRERAVELAGLVDAAAVVSALLPPPVAPDTYPAAADRLREVTARATQMQAALLPKAAAAGAAR